MASRRTVGPRATKRFIDSSDKACITAQNLDEIDFGRIVTKFETFKDAKRYLAQDLKNNKNFRMHWESAITEFGQMFRKKPISDEDFMKVGIIAYSLEDENSEIQQYSALNEQSKKIGRSTESWKQFAYKGWYAILAYALTELPTSPDDTEEGAPIKCYRGVTKQFKFRENDSLVFNTFTSTSRNKEKARDFASRGGTLFTFDCIPYNSLGIQNYSVSPTEQEVLLLPWSAFQVGEVNRESGSLTVVKLISQQLEDD